MNCSIEGCNKPVHAKLFCKLHYQRWYYKRDMEKPIYKICTIEDCTKEVRSKHCPYCSTHYQRWYTHGDPNYKEPTYEFCTIENCNKKTRSKGSPYCEMHYMRLRRNGTIEAQFDTAKYSNCVICGKLTNGRKYCSNKCSTRGSRGQTGTKECIVCKRLFEPDNYRINVCSDKCKSERQKEVSRNYYKRQMETNPAYKARVYTHYVKRKQKRVDKAVEFVVYDKIYERDNYTCQICKKPIDMALRWPNPKSPSIDHIIPLSKGGEHSYTNCQATHLRCNLRKNNKLPKSGATQLILFGQLT